MVLLLSLVFVLTAGCAFWLHDRLLDERRYDRKELRSNGQHYDNHGNRDGSRDVEGSDNQKQYGNQGDGSDNQKKQDDHGNGSDNQKKHDDHGQDTNGLDHDRGNNNGN